MWNEHFGISIVEMMAAGMVMIAHDSGGPQKDIMVPLQDGRIVGYVAASVEEYADRLADALSLSVSDARGVRLSARQSVQERFGDDVIQERVVALFDHILSIHDSSIPSTSHNGSSNNNTKSVVKEAVSSSNRENSSAISGSSARRSIKRKSISKKK